MSDDTRWGFEDADDWEYENSRRRPGPTEETPEAIIGQDGAGAVTVTVDPTAAPLSVKLAANWRSLADLRVLHANVLEAVNAATMQALVKQIEQPTAVVPDGPAAVEARNDTIDVEQTAIKQKIDDLGANWKMPNTKDMADASVADGDASDWKLD